MKILSVFLLMTLSLSALAKTTTVELVGTENRFSFEALKYSSVLYVAANPTCLEMRPTHFISIPSSREKREEIKVSKNKLTFESKLGGFCNYKMANASVLIKLDEGSTGHLTLFRDENAQSELDIICTEVTEYSQKRLKCREKGAADSDGNLSLHINPTQPTKINVHLE